MGAERPVTRTSCDRGYTRLDGRDLPLLRVREQRRRAVLRGVRRSPRRDLFELRNDRASGRPVLSELRHGGSGRPPRRGPGRGTPGRLDPVRRPGRVHVAIGPGRPRGRSTDLHPVPRDREGGDRAVRRRARQVHRRRCDGGVRGTDRPRGRPRTRGSGGPRDPDPRRRDGDPGTRGGEHGRGRRHVRHGAAGR